MTEMSDDELRARLSRLDPAPAGTPVDPATSPRARSLMEHAMTTPVQTPTPVVPAELPRRRRPWLLAVAAAAVLVALVSGALLLGGGGDGGTGSGQDPAPLALELPPADAAMSCIMFDVAFLAEMPVAFGGTVTAIEDGEVAVDVDRWYRGGEAEQVTIAVPGQQTSAALDGVDFRTGERYLITATDGTVNGCGFSGPATPELENAFAEAFGG
jgi:hypothetical protein